MFSPLRKTSSPAPPSMGARAGRALGLARAFLTLADAGAPEPAAAPHPHRRPLRADLGPRRPGAGLQRPQVCTTPLAPRPIGRPPRREPAAGRAS